MTTELYIGLMSGTSMDGIDCVLVEFGETSCHVVATCNPDYPVELADRLRRMAGNPASVDLNEVGALHVRVARVFADAALSVLESADVSPSRVTAIGSHGQTVLHHPDGEHPFSLQLGDPGTLAALVGAPVVADFRTADIALGGQGAPLAPAFHHWAFGHATEVRAVVNIGGIANVTRLDPQDDTVGYDTGPGNILLDQWFREHHEGAYDADGAWASGGNVADALLTRLQRDNYFSRTPPKSTGTDYFNRDWLATHLGNMSHAPDARDVQATLSELTARTIAAEIRETQAVAICGGGAFNTDLMRRLERLLRPCPVNSTSAWGIDPDQVEALAFAWFARQRLRGAPTNIPSVTGARKAVSLGGIFLPP